jgi:hypothetical protein
MIVQLKHTHLKSNKINKKHKRKSQGFNDTKNEVKPIRKPKQPNLEHYEVVFLFQVKRDENICSLNVINSMD